METNKKGWFDKVMDHSIDIAFLGAVGVWAVTTIGSVVGAAAREKRIEENRINNIKELQSNGANVDINLNGDI